MVREEDLPGSREAWRRELLERRKTLAPEVRTAREQVLADRLEACLAQMGQPLSGLTVGVYWPIRGEPDLRDLFRRWHGQGALLALPVVESSDRPLLFVRWMPDEVLIPGKHGVPVPVEDESHPRVSPQIMIIPCVGFDARGYRLGYGGGYYDRTLASRRGPGRSVRPPLALGVAWSEALVPNFEPSPFDLPLDAIITPDEAMILHRP